MKLPNELDNKQLMSFALMLAELSNKIALKYFRNKSVIIETKNDNSPVTIADREIEQLIRAHITEQYPEHSIYGEEIADKVTNSKYKWYIDPIDGTSSFVSGKPLFTNLIALVNGSKPSISVISQPYLKEQFYSDGINSYLNNTIIKTSKVTDIAKATLSTTSVEFFSQEQLVKFKKVAKHTNYQAHGGYFTGGDAYQYAMLALGHIDIVIECGLKPYDFMAVVPIIKNAGGIITNLEGKEITTASDGNVIACANQELHKKVMEIIN